MIEKIRTFKPLNNHEKAIVADYIAIMIKRTPEGETLLKKLLPNAVNELRHDLNQKFSIAATNQPHKIVFYEERNLEIGKILDKCFQDAPSKKLFSNTIPIKMTPKIPNCLKQMTWTFWFSKNSPIFLTCDNPVFFFPNRGIGNPSSELTFPISRHVALWLHRGQCRPKGYIPIAQDVAQIINQRTVINATRYVFHHCDEPWILPFVTKTCCRPKNMP